MKTKEINDAKRFHLQPGIRLTLIVAGVVFHQVAWFIAALAISASLYIVLIVAAIVAGWAATKQPKKATARRVVQ